MGTTVTALESFEEGVVEAGGFSIRYFARGEGNALAVIHGAGGLPDLADGPALELLADGRRMIVFELPGFGDSAPNTDTENARQMAGTLAAAMKALGIESYSVMGTSMGGVVALWWLADFNEQVQSVVLEAPAAFRQSHPPADLLSNRDAYINAFHAHPERKPWLADFELAMPPNWDLVTKIMGPDHDDDLADKLKGVETPVLLLVGDKDGIISTDIAPVYRALMPNTYFMIMYNAAHDLKGDRPEAFRDVVDDFLVYGPAFVINHESGLINP